MVVYQQLIWAENTIFRKSTDPDKVLQDSATNLLVVTHDTHGSPGQMLYPKEKKNRYASTEKT